jgi:hypothetical protein
MHAARVEKDAGPKRAAAIRAEKLTGREEWDWFLVELEKVRVDSATSRDRALDQIRDPSLASSDALQSARQQLLVREAELALLERVVSLPERLISEGMPERG